MKIKIQKIKKNAIIPTRGSKHAAGYDLYACMDSENVIIEANKMIMIGTGLSLEIPEGYFAGIFARSGLATKNGLRPANCVGVADSDYRGEYKVALYNDSEQNQVISNGDRIAQLVILPFLSVTFEEVNELSKTQRDNKGFGSTGK